MQHQLSHVVRNKPKGWWINSLQQIKMLQWLDTFITQAKNSHIMASIRVILLHSLPIIVRKVNRILLAARWMSSSARGRQGHRVASAQKQRVVAQRFDLFQFLLHEVEPVDRELESLVRVNQRVAALVAYTKVAFES